MEGDAHPSRVALRSARERTLEHLSEAFRKDEIGLDEFESRVDRAYGCATSEALAMLVADLSARETIEPVDGPPRGEIEVRTVAVVPEKPARGNRSVAVLSNLERRGKWSLRNRARALAVLGNVELDLREVDLADGVTEIVVRAVLGNVEIVVPPELAVECEGGGFLGSFAVLNRTPTDGGARTLRVVGSAVLGNVEIRTLPRSAPLHAPRLPPRM